MSSKKFFNYQRNVTDIFGEVNDYVEEIGVEIEVEGRDLPQRIPSYWTVHADGSLRNGGLEYVLNKPTSRKHIYSYLQYLEKKLKEFGATVVMTPRCSVHVHLTAKDMTILEVYLNLILYIIFEHLLVKYAGEAREGNLFCLRASDAEFFVERLRHCAEQDDYSAFWDEVHLRYTSVNICALQKFNSLEYRALRGTTDPDIINDWIGMLLRMKDIAKTYHTPTEIIVDFSVKGPIKFLEYVLGDYASRFGAGEAVKKALWDGMRLAQDIAYARAWEYSDVRPVQRTFAGTQGFAVDGVHGRRRPGDRGVGWVVMPRADVLQGLAQDLADRDRERDAVDVPLRMRLAALDRDGE